MKQMSDISEKLIAEQSDEILGVSQISWKSSPWSSSVSRTQKVYLFSDAVLYLGNMNENPQSNTVWERQLTVVQKFITIQSL